MSRPPGRPPRWTAELEAELAAVGSRKRGALAAFAERHRIPIGSVRTKLIALRIKGRAPDVGTARRGNPLPAARFRWLSSH